MCVCGEREREWGREGDQCWKSSLPPPRTYLNSLVIGLSSSGWHHHQAADQNGDQQPQQREHVGHHHHHYQIRSDDDEVQVMRWSDKVTQRLSELKKDLEHWKHTSEQRGNKTSHQRQRLTALEASSFIKGERIEEGLVPFLKFETVGTLFTTMMLELHIREHNFWSS